jgi:hypothetical protein
MKSLSSNLPIRGDLTLAYTLSLTVALFMVGASIAGLLASSTIYPTEELLQAFVSNDIINLVIGVPILLGSMWLARRGKLVGLLFWPGALLYVFYNYVVYVFGMPLNVVFPLYATLVVLSVYTMIGLVVSIDGEAVRHRLAGTVPVRLGGGVLAGLGVLFLVRAIAVMVSALISQTPVTETELALLLADFIVAPAAVIGGVLLWRREALGYVAAMGLLFQFSMLFIGLIVVLLLQPLLTAAPFVLTDVIVVLIMGMICFVPFALFVRGVVSTRK